MSEGIRPMTDKKRALDLPGYPSGRPRFDRSMATKPSQFIRRGRLSEPALLLAPALAMLLATFIGPLLILLSRSIFDPRFTLRNYTQIVTSSALRDVFGTSFEIAAISTAACLALAYPVAYVLAHAHGATRSALLGAILLSFWTNILVRCYAWIVMLEAHGAINLVLHDWLHLIPAPLSLVFNLPGVLVGMVYYLLPPTVLILDSAMRAVDRRLVLAAQSMGATPRQAFFRVFVPLTVPGIRAAGILVFVLSLGFYVTPALLGGREQLTVAILVENEFTEMLDWGFGSALAMVLLLLTLLGLCVYYLTQTDRRRRPSPARITHA